MKCPDCTHDNPGGQKFCGECGARLPPTCPGCGTANPPTSKFCGECGARLGADARPADASPATHARYTSPEAYTPKHLAEKILTSKQAIEGERKHVTVLFADVSGFTTMSESLDPEDVHAIMDRAFEVILGAVHRYEGTINQFLGDGVMALFGAPIAHEDHAERALSAALAVQEGLAPVAADIRRLHGIDFRMRIGINTGPVVVGAIGRDLRMDYTAVGDTTNLAARLLAIAKPGQIVVSARTAQLRDRLFAFEDLGTFQVKGKSEPVRAYALLRAAEVRGRLEVTRERKLTPLVGRAVEGARLHAAAERAWSGDGAIVAISGEPGVGKSRLIYEFLRRLDGTDVVELETTCASYGQAIPFRPVLELLRRYLGLSENATADDVRATIGTALGALALDGDERAVLLSHFAGVPASPEFLNRLSGAELRERTLAALGDVFLAASRRSRVAIVVENVHWMDPSSAAVLIHLAGRIPGHRMLLLLSSRPQYVPWLELPGIETIALEGLPESEIQRMIPELLDSDTVAPDLFAVLLEKGEGNPLYVEEIVHQLRETGGLVVENGQARLQGPGARVPATIQDIIAARVDRLDEALKLVLQGAAVIGRRFGVSLLSRVIDVPTGEAREHLDSLHRLDFVFPSATDPEPMYSFKHALTQDVVYLGLLERRRRLYHAAAGAGLEDLYRGRIGEVVELVAYHFGASAEDEKAVDYAVQAAEKAQGRWANTEALAYFEGALKRLDAMPDTADNRLRRIDAIVKQAEIKFALGRHAEHIRALEDIHELVRTTADPPRRAAWYYWTAFLHSLTGSRPDIPIAYCQEASSIARAAGLHEMVAAADCCLAHVYAYAGRLHEALEAGERALEVFEARQNIWWACRTLWGLSLTAIPLGQWARSLEYCRRALEYGMAVNDRRLKVVGWWRTGWTHIQQGSTAVGIQCCEEAIALSPSPFDAAMAKAAMGYGLVKAGKTEAGLTMLADAVDWFGQARLPFTRTWYTLWLADAHVMIGNPDRARALAEDVLPLIRDCGYRYFEGIAERLLGTSLVSVDPQAAVEHLTLGLQILEDVGARNEVAKTLVAQAQVRRVHGDRSAARELLQQALAIFETLGTVDEAPRVRARLAAA